LEIIQDDLWDKSHNVVCVTTNSVVTRLGELVMGGGVALEAKLLYPNLPRAWGNGILQLQKQYGAIDGNRPQVYIPRSGGRVVVSYPTKHHFKDPSPIELVRVSAERLVQLADKEGWEKIYFPAPGCGLGGLKLEDVLSVIAPVLDDRFVLCLKGDK